MYYFGMFYFCIVFFKKNLICPKYQRGALHYEFFLEGAVVVLAPILMYIKYKIKHKLSCNRLARYYVETHF